MKFEEIKHLRFVTAFILLIGTVCGSLAESRPRVIVTTDGEGDDKDSMVRFLVYNNEFDLKGIIYSSSTFHWDGTRWSGKEWIQNYIELYGKCYDNLKQHDPGYRSPEELRKLIFVGNIKGPGTMEEDTPGSDRIADVLLDDDPRPVYLQAWGGANTIARALYKIQHEHPEAMERVSKKAVIYNIQDQDVTMRRYIQPNWPDLQILASYEQFRVFAYKWAQLMPSKHHHLFSRSWLDENVRNSHGPVGAQYTGTKQRQAKRNKREMGGFNSEGDTPAYIHQIDVGLRSLEHPSYGGWGGRFIPERNGSATWMGAEDEGDLYKPIWRWIPAIQNDWAARMDWCVKNRDEANHPPVVRLAHAADLTVDAEKTTLELDATPSTDPDGDKLTFRWWQYTAADTIHQHVDIQNTDGPKCSINYDPYFARKNDTIHMICEVSDNGTPPLTRYARVIVTVRENKHSQVILNRLEEYAEELKTKQENRK